MMKKLVKDQSCVNALEVLEDILLFLPFDNVFKRQVGIELSARIRENARFEDGEKLYNLSSKLLTYFRSQKSGVPDYFEIYISEAFKSYCKEIPLAFQDFTIKLSSLAHILTFIFKMQSIVISQGVDQNEMFIAIKTLGLLELPPNRKAIALLAEALIDKSKEDVFRKIIGEASRNPLMLGIIPQYIEGLFYAIPFADNVKILSESISRALLQISIASSYFPILDNPTLLIDNAILSLGLISRYLSIDSIASSYLFSDKSNCHSK